MKTQGKVASIPYTLERRRTSRLISVRVLADGTVKVNAPYRVSLAAIERVIVSHQETLRQAIADQKMHLHTYQNGDVFLFGGEQYTLELRQGTKQGIVLNENACGNFFPDKSTAVVGPTDDQGVVTENSQSEVGAVGHALGRTAWGSKATLFCAGQPKPVGKLFCERKAELFPAMPDSG